MQRQSNAVMNLGRFLTLAALRMPCQPALIRGESVRTYGQMNARADALARVLVAMGLAKGDPVLIHSGNCMEMAEAMYGVWKAGGVIVPTNFRAAPKDLVGMAHAAHARFFIGNAEFSGHLDAAAEDGFASGRTLVIGDGFEEAIAAHSEDGAFTEIAVERDDPAWYFFTSGTTGFPKCAVLAHGQLGFVLVNHVADLMPGLDHRHVSMAVAPLSHGAGLHLFVQVTQCVPTILMASDRLDPEEFWQLVEKHRVTNMFTVPTIVKRVVEHPAVNRYDHSNLRHVVYAGAPMYRTDQVQALHKLGPCLVQYFGLGEVTGCITVLPADEHSTDDAKMRVGSCGFARTGIDIAILDETGQRLDTGTDGLIGVRGPAVFSGYLDNPAANADCFVDGWFLTGDIGHLDEAGHLYLTGRRSDMYISGGSNIYPLEIEEVFLTHPAIAEIAIVGVPDPDWGEAGAAMIVPVAGQTIDEDELLSWAGTRVARYKLPRHVVIAQDLPKSGYGKIEKKTVRAALLEGALQHLKELA